MKWKIDVKYSYEDFHETYIVEEPIPIRVTPEGYLKFKTIDDKHVTIMLANVLRYTQIPIKENEADLVNALKTMGEN